MKRATAGSVLAAAVLTALLPTATARAGGTGVPVTEPGVTVTPAEPSPNRPSPQRGQDPVVMFGAGSSETVGREDPRASPPPGYCRTIFAQGHRGDCGWLYRQGVRPD